MGGVGRPPNQAGQTPRLHSQGSFKRGIDSQAMLARLNKNDKPWRDGPSAYRQGARWRPSPRTSTFFVMELVDGLPLTTFCDKKKLGIRERLELFVAICQAVQHAHQRGSFIAISSRAMCWWHKRTAGPSQGD